ncbi:hypothetical protein ACFLT0_00670, partial [Chloroflexota bacterium]
VSSYNPGQYYAVSTINVLEDVDELVIGEDFHLCDDVISVLNPKKGGGKVVIVQVGPGDDVAYQIYDANSDEIVVHEVGGYAIATLEDVAAGTTIYMYVKFGPAMKGEVFAGPYECENWNGAAIEGEQWIASALLKLIAKDN